MIMKNGEATLERCLQSVRNLFGEIIVVDTGSTDRSREIATGYGARVVDFPWADNFAAARNISLEHATGDWVFWLDADEWLDPSNRQKLEALLANLPHRNSAFLMRQCSALADGPHAINAVDQVRLFRSHDGLSWRYRVHEQILPSLQSFGAALEQTDIVICHAGFAEAAVLRSKVERNLRLLELEIREQPDDPFVLYNLGAVHLTLGRYPAALAYLRKSLSGCRQEDSFTPKLLTLIIRCHHARKEFLEAMEACRRGRSLFPRDAELRFWEAVLLRENGDLTGCAACLEQLLRLSPGKHLAGADAGLYTYRTHYFLAETYLLLGRSEDALCHLRAAVASNPDYISAWQQLARSGLERQDWPELNEALSHLKRVPDLALEAAILEGGALLAQKKFSDARAVVERTLRNHPAVLPLRILLTHILILEGKNWGEAEKALRAVLDLDPGHTESQHNLRLLLKRQGSKYQKRSKKPAS
jgi:glycosyltransferase involved in cell wall biosynthesis